MLTYLHGDHLGSARLATCGHGGGCDSVPLGGKVSEMRYYPYGQTRSGAMPTDRQFTGQRRETGLGLYDYQARFYDPYLSRFIQADTIIPDPKNPQSLNRYSYVLNNPLKYVDPSGHWWEDPGTGALMPGYGPLSMPESWEVGKGTYNDIEPLKVYSCGASECHGAGRRNARGLELMEVCRFQDQDQIEK